MKHGISPDTFPPRSHEAKRVSVVEAAASVFCREGYAGANIDLIAAEAGVSRQTVYNHHGDKEKLFVAVVRDLTERCNAGIFATIATFPDQPTDLEADLVAFAVRMNRNCICNRDGRFLRKLIQAEGERYPELFAEWREQGPGRTWSALAARFARLAFAGHLSIGDPDVAARQFLALVNAELQITFMLGGLPTEEEVLRSAANGVRTFLGAFARKKLPAGKQAALVHA
ncbi:TetR/AcrR family transcriptional regulator [Mesorhizobium sp. B3-1-6]|uniref:TetR/AcrR family transcriptional regulator n=1 Tax=unclassified Mesorhizobium TaxID=325217 RepID=UPI001126765F|nr:MULTISPECIES: TetR/AcrR family transcriptional regulator [unclassified Mesorhizobium]TPI39469.1 TetR/AcrR family transcriptional regulator [Mesorhizobium sp. B3-1-6]TPI59459.1 TetR/AcrR family transcriptional regulator [Mesorhizobium sp. B3-1-7]TPI65977.1 TetR/AcrR family transcriptional regulator [Mesorhizobium sp. B3-1-8]TPI70998.1 TetR/AcrR family transcriptional regulator [Mesorhizobium sp. B3-1-3]TPJ32357.1 TetR/AcrR family transcriptional regulator [Mesorhizobium sp. B2-8-3]